MRVLIICVMILLVSLAAFAQPSDYDQKQDERFYNYVQADSVLSGQVTTELSSIKWILGIIAVAVVGGAVGLIFSAVKKKLSLPVIIAAMGFCWFIAAIPVQEAECQWCDPAPCRVDADCLSGCICDQYYFQCR